MDNGHLYAGGWRADESERVARLNRIIMADLAGANAIDRPRLRITTLKAMLYDRQ